MKIIGIDLSLTSPACCVFEGDEFNFNGCYFYYYTTNKKDRLLPNQLNNLVDEMRKKEKLNFTKLLIEKQPIQTQDSIIYNVVFFHIKESDIKFHETEN